LLDGFADFAQPVSRDHEEQVFLLHAGYRDPSKDCLVMAIQRVSRVRGLPAVDPVRRRRLLDTGLGKFRGCLTESASDQAKAT
jgi:hypothetical protein